MRKKIIDLNHAVYVTKIIIIVQLFSYYFSSKDTFIIERQIDFKNQIHTRNDFIKTLTLNDTRISIVNFINTKFAKR